MHNILHCARVHLPQGVPMGRPTSGVKPIEVVNAFPPSMAHMEEPLPMWQE
jgi:hypothetical protein